MTRHVVLLGLMGAGKTSIGRLVAERLARPFVDGDERLAARTGGRTAAEVADLHGIEHLHLLETEIALDALGSADPAVIGPASSVAESITVRDALPRHHLVWLTAPAEHLAAKAGEKSHRPMIDDRDPLELVREQLAVREPLVMALRPLVIDVAAADDDEAAGTIVAFVEAGAGG